MIFPSKAFKAWLPARVVAGTVGTASGAARYSVMELRKILQQESFRARVWSSKITTEFFPEIQKNAARFQSESVWWQKDNNFFVNALVNRWQDILEVVREQTELLKEQLDLLCHIPQCHSDQQLLTGTGNVRGLPCALCYNGNIQSTNPLCGSMCRQFGSMIMPYVIFPRCHFHPS